MTAKTVIDVILGEARAGDFNDMLHIASVIENRARALGVTPEQVVRGSGQFDAYGKPLPRGVDRYREQAAAALDQVKSQGPVTGALYYATPDAAKNLPKGLQSVTQTRGHVYFDDPKNRAIVTSAGAKPVNTAALGSARTVTPGLGLANLAPKPSAKIEYDLSGKGRSQVPSSGIGRKVAESINRVIPGGAAVMFSGQEPAGARPVGTPFRHPNGYAGDFRFKDAQGNPVTNDMALHDIAMDMAAKNKANIGYSNNSYMGRGSMHIDTMPLDRFPGGAQWGNTAKGWSDNLQFARKTGIGPTPLNGPAPAERPSGPLPRSTGYNAIASAMSPPRMSFSGQSAAGSGQSATGTFAAQAAPATAMAEAQQPEQSIGQRAIRAAFGTPQAAAATATGEISVAPVQATPSAADLAAQYAQYRPMTAPTQTIPSVTGTGATIAGAPASAAAAISAPNPALQQFPAAPMPSLKNAITNNKKAIGGALVGAALGGVPGAVVGGLLGRKFQNGGSINPFSGMQSPFGGNGKYSGPMDFVNPSQFNNSLGFGGGSNAAGFVQSGYAPRGSAYADSMGGTSVSFGNGMAQRTNRYGVTELMDAQGRTYDTRGGGGLFDRLFG